MSETSESLAALTLWLVCLLFVALIHRLIFICLLGLRLLFSCHRLFLLLLYLFLSLSLLLPLPSLALFAPFLLVPLLLFLFAFTHFFILRSRQLFIALLLGEIFLLLGLHALAFAVAFLLFLSWWLLFHD